MRRVIAALLGVAAGFALLVVWLELGRESGATGQAAVIMFFSVLAAGCAALYLCCKRYWWEIWRFILFGALGGSVCALPFSGGSFSFGFLLVLFLLAGSGAGVLFWLAAIWRNDNLTCPKSFCLPCGVAYKVARNALRQRHTRSHALQNKTLQK